MWFWIKSGGQAEHGQLEGARMLKWESAQLSYRLLFLFLRDRTSGWPALARGGRTVCLWVFIFKGLWDLKTEFHHYSEPI